MSFYKSLSDYYDDLFPVAAGEMDFLINQVKGVECLLDIGCGTGNKTILFKDAAKVVFGIDIDHDMLEKAREKHGAPNVTYVECDLESLDKEFTPEGIDAVLCLGNVLAHFNSLRRIQSALIKIGESTSVGGKLIVQILNYDRIIKNRIEELPVLETDKVKFMRHTKWHNDKIFFLTTLAVKGTGKVYSSNTQFYALTRDELEQSLFLAGFEGVKYYGDFDGGPWDEDSFLTLAVAQKFEPLMPLEADGEVCRLN